MPSISNIVQAPPAPLQLPRHANRLKVTGLRTILEEKILSIEGVRERYPEVWELIKFHKFEVFTKPKGSYVL